MYDDDDEREIARERRKRKALERLGFSDPKCFYGCDAGVLALDLHHIAGRAHHDDVWPVCRNHHAELTDLQNDHPRKVAPPRNPAEIKGRYLLGISDLLELIIRRLREFGEDLIRQGQST